VIPESTGLGLDLEGVVQSSNTFLDQYRTQRPALTSLYAPISARPHLHASESAVRELRASLPTRLRRRRLLLLLLLASKYFTMLTASPL